MLLSLKIYAWALGFYALLTFPCAFLVTPVYFISLIYAVLYGNFAFLLFWLLYYLIIKTKAAVSASLMLLGLAVPAAVIFSFQMIEWLRVESNVWHSGVFLLFPVAAVISGWLSLYCARKEIRAIIYFKNTYHEKATLV